jgi:biopolymer transport protein ExbB
MGYSREGFRVMTVSSVVTLLAKGGLVMIPLAVCSVLSLAVVLERAWFWWAARAGGAAERVLELAALGKWDDAIDHARASRAPQARVLGAGLEHRETGPTLAMQAAVRDETARMRRALPVLDTIVTLSPLLGLLGTVTGMIAAFGVISTSGLDQPHAITGGVAEALIATAAGLAVAIATLVPYNCFLARAERTLDEIEAHGTRLELVLTDHHMGGLAAGPPSPPDVRRGPGNPGRSSAAPEIARR